MGNKVLDTDLAFGESSFEGKARVKALLAYSALYPFLECLPADEALYFTEVDLLFLLIHLF